MVDRPPPSRFSVVERGGRLVVIDRETGQTPLTAAERMDAHDRNLGVEPIRPAQRQPAPDTPVAASAVPVRVTATAGNGKDRIASAIAARDKRPRNPKPGDRPALKSNLEPARGRPAPQGVRKTIVTGKWWDSKGPRTIELGPKGQRALGNGFVTLFIVAAIAAVAVLFIAPVVLFVAAFLLFRFGGAILGPIGAGLVDKALAEKG